jgi:hypothetical protein
MSVLSVGEAMKWKQKGNKLGKNGMGKKKIEIQFKYISSQYTRRHFLDYTEVE